MSNPLQTFRDILTDKGLIPAEIMADGKLHRCPTQTKPHKQNGAYIAHVDIPATLWWCNWENGEQGTFCTEEKQTLSVSELSAWRERQHSIQRQREAEYAERHAEAAQLARQEWNSARRCDANHPYLHRKGITALESIRQARDGSLLIPVMDAANNLQSLQRIYPDGTKRFLVGGKVSGGQFIIQGQSEKPVAVCEGFATGTSIHLATGWTVYVAFSANNLARVAKTVKERFPDKTIIICGDNDEAGLRKGEDAAGLANAQLLFPHFTDDNGTDFNDLHQIEGIEAVRSQLETALTKQQGLIALDMGEFLSMSIPERGYLLSPVLPVQGIGHPVRPARHRQDIRRVEHRRCGGFRRSRVQLACADAQTDAVCGWGNARHIHAEPPFRSCQRHVHSPSYVEKHGAHHTGPATLSHAGFVHRRWAGHD